MPEKPTKLYEAIVIFNLYLLASDEDDARGVAVRNAAAALGKLSPRECLGHVTEVTDGRNLRPEWRDARPYATPGTQYERLTCAEALREIQANAWRADLPGQRKLFEEA